MDDLICVVILTFCAYNMSYIAYKYIEFLFISGGSRHRTAFAEVALFTILFFAYIRILDILEEEKRKEANFLIRYYLM